MVLFLVSCAAPSGREYHDGPVVERTPVFVSPGHTPAGAGLPEYMPVYETPTIERGRDRRVLPPTREPGIWMSDGDPKAVIGWDDNPVRLLGVEVPFPAERVGRIGDKDEPGRSCAWFMTKAAGFPPIPLAGLSEKEHKCLAARLYQHCFESDLADFEDHQKRFRPKLPETRKVEILDFLATAKAFKENACDGVKVTDAMRLALNDITRKWAALPERH